MPQYLSPGVYVEEVDSGSRPIEGVGTAVAAFIGLFLGAAEGIMCRNLQRAAICARKPCSGQGQSARAGR